VTEIAVPKLNNNDESYVLIDWLYDEGQQVPAGEPVVVVETSKATEDLPCEDGGFLHRLAAVRDECRPGQVIGMLFGTREERERYLAQGAAADAGGTGAAPLVVTDGARELAGRHGLTDENLRGLGRTVIRRADVQRLLDGQQRPAAGDRTQQAIAEVVSESHRSIPVAFTLARLDVSAALAAARELAARTERLVGLPDLLISAVAGLRDEFPMFFAATPDSGVGIGIGVTIDVGQGLYIPVIHDAARLDLGEVADALMRLRVTAMRGAFRERDLIGASLSISLNTDNDIVFAQPIIVPGQVCMVSLGATMREITLGPDSTLGARQIAHVGIAYDHRVVNGREAAEFLRRIGERLAEPAAMAEPGATPEAAPEPERVR
jgi:2-oxoglutarate dehydrogenase E2 component (dihydrolipoamide succinyltransferase)